MLIPYKYFVVVRHLLPCDDEPPQEDFLIEHFQSIHVAGRFHSLFLVKDVMLYADDDMN